MKKIKPLHPDELRQTLTPSQLEFNTTEEIKSLLSEFIGQERALEALNFGIGIKSQGYNLYAMGPSGIGKFSLVHTVLDANASKLPVPPDYCYIHNFDAPEKPIALEFPAGVGSAFQQDMKTFIEELLSSILTVYESDQYRVGMKKINDYFNERRIKIRKKLKQELVEEKTNRIPSLYKERHEKVKTLRLRFLSGVIDPIMTKIKKKYEAYPLVLTYLTAVENDLIEHVEDLIKQDDKTNLFNFSLDNPVLTKYKVNLLVDNSHLKGAPVIYEETPHYSNLICRVEHTTQEGSLVTNFTLIKPGALHRANGGYLIIEARKLKKQKDAWEALKSALYSHKIKVEPIQDFSDSVKPVSLEPMPIPLNVKIILLGDRNSYYHLTQYDPDFNELFKVAVDFDEQIDRNKKNVNLYAKLIGTIVKRESLRSFHATAVAAIIDHSTRLAEDIDKLSTHIRDIQDLILESDYWAGDANKKIVDADDVKRAIHAQVHRMDRAKELYYDDIKRDFIIINTAGHSLGQVNCLSVRRVGNFSYGHPTRVSARVKAGKNQLIDIQREIKLAGPMHSKAGLIITNFLGSRFSSEHLFALSASIAFEQIYCWTDGDSASVGELCALLSALSDVPIAQHFAVTGSIDQYGEVQAIGGVNEKIEGFYDVCLAAGLTGKQGVIIPEVNKKNLMLREDIVEAAKKKKFHIYPIKTIDEAITLLMGEQVVERDKQGNYPKDSIYDKIEKRLADFSRQLTRKK